MGHELDITDGQASYADSRVDSQGRVDAWHKLGTPVGHAMTVDEALDAAHMRGWDVRTEPLTASVTLPDGTTVALPVPDRQLVLRTNPINAATEALGVVGMRYTPFANETTTGLLEKLVDAGGAHVETIGALRGGRDTFVTMRMPGHMEFRSPITGALDTTDLYISVLNNHTGQAPLRALIAPVRIVCANTQRMAENAARSVVTLRHTGDPAARMREVRELLGLTFAYRDTYVEQCERLIARELDSVVVLDVIEDVFGVKAATTERQETPRKERAGEVIDLYRTSPTVAPFKGTAYGVYNAVTEYLDHYAPVAAVKASDEEKAIMRARRTLMSADQAEMKGRAFSLLATL